VRIPVPAGLNPAANKWARIVNDELARLEGMILTVEARPVETTPEPDVQGEVSPLQYSLAADVTFAVGDLKQFHWINCTSASAITLPIPIEGYWVWVLNHGAQALTIKTDGAATMCVLAAGQWTHIPVVNASGTIKWPTGAVVMDDAGGMVMNGDIQWDSNSFGPVVFDASDGKWYRLGTSSGSVTATNVAGPL